MHIKIKQVRLQGHLLVSSHWSGSPRNNFLEFSIYKEDLLSFILRSFNFLWVCCILYSVHQ
jgi:hypothetical protein